MAALQRKTAIPGFIALLGLATIAGAWGFQLIGGYIPCPLCLEQRIPYYVGIPLAIAAMAAALIKAPAWLWRVLLLAIAIAFAWGAWLGIYQAGAEWGFWLGPADCSAGAAPAATSAGDLLSQIEGMHIVSCTEASWRFPAGWGLSFAGWNAVVSLVLACTALWGAAKR